MTRLIILFSLLAFFIVVSTSLAATFTASSSPTTLASGQSSQLINFSIANTGSVNITHLNITLPPGFAFTGSSGTTNTNPYTASSSSPAWTNSSILGLIGNGATQYFWIYVDTPLSTGSNGFNISTTDITGAFTSNNVSLTLFDIIAPAYSSNTTTPSSNTSYAQNQSYWFNITWTDNVGISKVLLEHNITGSSTIHNETMSNSSSVYYFNTSDLSAGTYVWRVYANDTNNTFNSTIQFTYLVAKATNTLKVYLNGSLNTNITAINNTAINITTNATCSQTNCNVTITRDNTTTVASGVPNTYTINDVITSIGLHNYTVTVATNTNYSTNTATYFVATVPSYTTTTSNIPLTFSNTTYSIFNTTFASNPGFVTSFIEGGWSTTQNFTLTNSSLYYYYNASLPAGTHSWRIFGKYQDHVFNLTPSTSFTINKAAAPLTLTISPQWELDTPVQTVVTCSVGVSGLTANLYRNLTSVSNPETQTFTAGSKYEYLCNSTSDQNYTTGTSKNTLSIKLTPSASISFIQYPQLIEIIQNQTNITEIKIKNTGGVEQNITLDILDLDKSWYTIDQATKKFAIGQTLSYTITFTIKGFDIRDYAAKFSASSTNTTVTKDFTLRILPSAETKIKINDTLILYKLEASKLESEFNAIKNTTNNTEPIEQKLNELKAALKQAEDYITANDYFNAEETLDIVQALIAEIEARIESAEPNGLLNVSSSVWIIVVVILIIVIVAFVGYLFWPSKKGYRTATGYVFAKPADEKKPTGLKKFFSMFGRKKKTITESK